MISISLNGTSLNQSPSATGYSSVIKLRHDSTPDAYINMLEPTYRDGAKLISFFDESKEVVIQGTIKASSQADFDDFVDQFKANVYVLNGTLSVEYAGSTREYTVSTASLAIQREHSSVTFCTFDLTLMVDKGYAYDPSYTELYSAEALSDTSTAQWLYFDGTARPAPLIRMDFDTIGKDANPLSIAIEANSKRIEVGTSWLEGDQLEIDCDTRSVTRNGSTVDYTGEFPEFTLGDNQLSRTIEVGSAIVAQAITANGDTAQTWNYNKIAQSVNLGSNAVITGCSLYFNNFSEVPDEYKGISIRIETDNAGEPSGTLVHPNAQFSDYGTNPIGYYNGGLLGWFDFTFDGSFTLTAGTKYWIVISENLYEGYYFGLSTEYPNGGYNATDAFGAWLGESTADIMFKLSRDVSTLFGGTKYDFDVKYKKRFL